MPRTLADVVEEVKDLEKGLDASFVTCIEVPTPWRTNWVKRESLAKSLVIVQNGVHSLLVEFSLDVLPSRSLVQIVFFFCFLN